MSQAQFLKHWLVMLAVSSLCFLVAFEVWNYIRDRRVGARVADALESRMSIRGWDPDCLMWLRTRGKWKESDFDAYDLLISEPTPLKRLPFGSGLRAIDIVRRQYSALGRLRMYIPTEGAWDGYISCAAEFGHHHSGTVEMFVAAEYLRRGSPKCAVEHLRMAVFHRKNERDRPRKKGVPAGTHGIGNSRSGTNE